MSVEDEYTEHKNALSRASMTLWDWICETRNEATPEWIAGNIADPVELLEKIASAYLAKKGTTGQGLVSDFYFDKLIEEEANRRMQLARDKYEEEYGKRP